MLTMPGYAACFASLWESNVAVAIMRAPGSSDAVKEVAVKEDTVKEDEGIQPEAPSENGAEEAPKGAGEEGTEPKEA